MSESRPTRGNARAVRPIRHGRLRRVSPFATIAKVLVAIVAVAAVSSSSVAAIAFYDVSHSFKHSVHLVTSDGKTEQPIPSIAAISGGVNLLLAGTDTRTGQGGVYNSSSELDGSSGAGNNDVTILVHIAANHQSVSVISFPRDLMIPIPACPTASGGTIPATDSAMLNTTLSRGGLSCVVLTIEHLTGIQNIPFAAEISFDGVTAMSDAVGGVTVCLASPVKDNYTTPPLNLPAGNVTLVGPEALSFLRSRHGVGDGSDLGRISSQEVFMSALARKITSAGVLANPLQLYPLAKAAATNITLSDSLDSVSTLVQIGLALKDVGTQNMTFFQYPVEADPTNPNRVIVNQSAAQVVDASLINDQPVTLTGGTGRAAEASPTPAAPATTAATPAATATATPTPSASSNAVVLPPSVTGQTANEQTCTKGNSY